MLHLPEAAITRTIISAAQKGFELSFDSLFWGRKVGLETPPALPGRVTSTLLSAGKGRLLPIAGGLIALIAVADYGVGNRMSLGVLYVLPMMLGGLVLSS